MASSRLVYQIVALTLFRVLINTGRRFVYPFAPALSRGLEVPLGAITSIIAVSQFSSLLGVFSGPLADRFGYRRVMRSALALLAVGMLVCGLVPTYWPVFFGLIVASLGKVVFDPAIQAFVGSRVPFARRARVVGVIETAWAGSTLIGIPALALIIDHVGLRNSFIVMGLLGGLCWLAIPFFIPPDQGEDSAGRTRVSLLAMLARLVRIRSAAGMLIFGFFISVANDGLFVVYGAWFEQDFHIGIVALGFSTVAIGSAELLGESLVALFSDRIGIKRATIGGFSLAACAYLLLPIIGQTLSLAMVGMFLLFFCYEFAIVSSFSLSTELVPEARATMMAGFYATAGVGRMVGVLLGGLAWQVGGIHLVCWLAAGSTVCGVVALLWGLRGWRPA
jgi:MFS transporter, DHA1 family, inner membrane transport protein